MIKENRIVPKNPKINPSTVFLGDNFHSYVLPKNFPPNKAKVSFIETNKIQLKNHIIPLYNTIIESNPEELYNIANIVQKNNPI